jgi:phenylalanyl-tRNA synthetase beta chain
VTAVTVVYLAPGQTAALTLNGETIGLLGQVSPVLAERAGAPKQDAVFVAELDLDALERHRTPDTEWVAPLPRYPFVVRDLSIVVPDALPAEIIRGTIQAAGSGQFAPLTAITFFDRYQGKGVPDGSVSVSIRLTFQAQDRTLTDPEVQTTFDTILAALVREHAAVQR